MKDRWGNKILVGWAPHEIEWVRAAMTLAQCARREAYADIASMTGRSVGAIQDRAIALKVIADADAAQARCRRIFVPERSQYAPPRLMPSELRKPTRAELMGCR